MYHYTRRHIRENLESQTERFTQSNGSYFGRDVHKVLVGKPEGKRQLGRPRRRWKDDDDDDDNNKTDLQEVGRGCGDWMELAQDRGRGRALVSTVMNFLVP